MSMKVSTGNSLPIQDFNCKAILVNDNDESTVNLFADSLHNTNLFDNLKALFTSKSQYVNSLRWYPFDLSQFMSISSTASDLTLGGVEAKWGGTVTYNVKCKRVNSIVRAVKIATIHISRYYQDFMDYEPYTTAQIYLPYLGFYAFPLKDCVGDDIDVYYSIDFDTGMATAYVESHAGTSGTDRVILMASGKIGIDIPIGGDNSNEIAKDVFNNSVKLLASGIAIAGGVTAGKVAGGIIAGKGMETALSSGVNFVTGQQVHYQRGSLTGGQDALPSPTDIYIVYHRPMRAVLDMNLYAKTKGRPLSDMRTLSFLTGFTKVEEIHLEGFTMALKSEVDEIESLLHEGVIL